MSIEATTAAVRRCVLAVSVLDDLDVIPADDGFTLVGDGTPAVFATLAECRDVLGDSDPDGADGRARLSRFLFARRWIADRIGDELAELARPVALPVGHPLHPGRSWVRKRILGGVLEVGLGLLGLDPADPDSVLVVHPAVFTAISVDPSPWWVPSMEYLEDMGAMATARWRRQPKAALKPMGDCDVVTLLASAVFRGAVCADSGGLQAAVVPMRTRGWLDPTRIDPAFAQAAAALTSAEERAFPRPILLTIDEVVMVPPGGRPAEIVLRDPAAADDRWKRDILYR
jgi:hypothetical protein